jgi:hypothetical protein
MKYWGKGDAFVGSAGILPAAAGMLPGAFFSRRGATVHNSFSGRTQTVRQNAGQSGQHARSPSTFTIHDVTIHEVHANRADI